MNKDVLFYVFTFIWIELSVVVYNLLVGFGFITEYCTTMYDPRGIVFFIAWFQVPIILFIKNYIIRTKLSYCAEEEK